MKKSSTESILPGFLHQTGGGGSSGGAGGNTGEAKTPEVRPAPDDTAPVE